MNRILMMLALAGCSSSPTAEMGEPLDYEYKFDDRTHSSRVSVLDCTHTGPLVRVQWEVTNLSKLASNYADDNKVLVDGEGRMFHTHGAKTEQFLDPTESAGFVTVYTLPPAADTSSMGWGLRNTSGEELRYRINLDCKGTR